jgi:hypothetical protein
MIRAGLIGTLFIGPSLDIGKRTVPQKRLGCFRLVKLGIVKAFVNDEAAQSAELLGGKPVESEDPCIAEGLPWISWVVWFFLESNGFCWKFLGIVVRRKAIPRVLITLLQDLDLVIRDDSVTQIAGSIPYGTRNGNQWTPGQSMPTPGSARLRWNSK